MLKSHRIIISFFFVFVFFVFNQISYASNWPQFHYSPDLKGFNPNENILNPSNVSDVVLKWSNSIISGAYSSPAIYNGVLYIGSRDHNLYAFDANNGNFLWASSIGGGTLSSPAVNNGVVYIGSNGIYPGQYGLYAFNSSNGALLWKDDIGVTDSSPTVINGAVYISGYNPITQNSRLYSISATSGNIIWSADNGLPTVGSPAVAEGVVYIGSGSYYLQAFNINTGNLLWNYSTAGPIHSSPAVSNGIVYFGSDDGKIYAINALLGNLMWSYYTGNKIRATPAVANGIVYVGSGYGSGTSLYAFDSLTGDVKWVFVGGGNIESSPAVANGVVYFTATNGKLYMLNSTTGGLIRSLDFNYGIYTSPAVVNGKIYFGTNEGKIYAFGLLVNDITPPTTTLTQSPLPNANGWNNTNVNITLNATDNNGGSGIKEIHYTINGGTESIISNSSANFTVTNEGTSTINYWAVDNAGNIETTNSYQLKIDKTPPTIVINSPINGNSYILNQPIAADWSATDSFSGLASSTGTVNSGLQIDTSTAGNKIFTVTAIDKAGNVATKTVNYKVIYNFSGFQSPLGNNKLFKTGGTIPIKFQLTDYNGNIISNATVYLYVAKITNDVIGTDEAAISTSNADTGNQFRYDSTSNIYIYNLSTQNAPLGTAGTYQLKASLDDGSYYTSTISLK